MRNKFYSFLILYLMCFHFSQAQELIKANKLIGQPVQFNNPLGFDDEDMIKAFISKRGKKSKFPWIVISDRENNVVYDEPGGRPLDFTLKFKEYFNVLEEKGDWIHIVKVSPKSRILKIRDRKVYDYGWVEKSKMLLWKKGLLDPVSLIHQKAFLLNRATDLRRLIDIQQNIKKNIAKIYTHPVKSTLAEERHIYEFYFILKKEKNRYLLGKNANINTIDLDETIIGWVNSNRLEEWNTRVALEPNFKKEAFDERKNDPNKRLIGYADEEGANVHAKMGIPHTGHVLWDNDPVLLSAEQLDKETGRRFKGTVVRFPLFNKIGQLYRSGVIGNINVKTFNNQLETISEIDYSLIQKRIENMKISGNNYDILFLVEAREGLEMIKPALIKVIKEIKSKNTDINFRFSIAIYRDLYDREDGKMFDILPLTSKTKDVFNYIDNIVFGSANDFDDWTTIHYNLKQAILQAGFNKENSNILFLLGSGGDYRSSTSRRLKAKKDKDETWISSKSIIDLLSSYNINISSFQIVNKGTEPYRRFIQQVKYLTLETAKQQFNIYRNINNFVPEINLKNPEIIDDNSSNILTLQGGSVISQIIHPKPNEILTDDDIFRFLKNSIDNVVSEKTQFINSLTDVFIKGNSFESSAGSLSAPMAKFLKEIMGDRLDEATIKKLLKEKYKLYTEVYLPEHIKGAEYPTTSYVLFMPYNELTDYIDQLDKLAIAADKDISQQREELYNTLISLLNQYTGFDMSKRELKNATLDDLRNKMQGLNKEGVKLKGFINFRLEDIRDDRKMTDEEVDKFSTSILYKLKKLTTIKSLRGKYEFSYTTEMNNIYFWIPFEDTL